MRSILIFVFFFISELLFSQNGGVDSYTVLDLETSPRIVAMGGNAISIYDSDVLLSQTTPSLINSSMNNKFAVAFSDYFSNINILSFSYVFHIKSLTFLSLSVKSVNYGTFDLNDEIGNTIGSFSSSDNIFTLGVGKKLKENISIGVNFNLLSSDYETYQSIAVSSNFSATYFNSKNKFSSTFLLKNLGRQITSYTNSLEEVPYEIQLAISKELEYLPFRYHLSYNDLTNFYIDSPYKLAYQTNPQSGELELKQENIAKTFLRHIILGGELNLFRRSLFLRGGYNFQRRFDMSINSFPSFVGFSWGIGYNLQDFSFDFSRSSYHLSGIINNFSIAINLSTFGR